MAGRKPYVTPGFIAAMIVLGAAGIVIVVLAAVFVSWCLWKYYLHLSRPSPAMIQIRNRIRETESIRSMEGGSAAARGGIHRVAVGVPPGFIHSLPMLRYSKSGAHLALMDTKGHMSECPVCLTEYKEAERIRLLPNCKHVFHPICISTWLESHTTCPLCRTDVQVSPKNARNQSSLERILGLIRRSGGNQIVDSSARDRYSGRQRVTVVTPPPQQHSSNASGPPVLTISHPQSSRPVSHELQEVQASETPAPLTSSSALEAGMIFSSVWGPYVDVHTPGLSSSSSSGFTQVTIAGSEGVTTAGSEDGCSSATGFVAVSLDTDQPER